MAQVPAEKLSSVLHVLKVGEKVSLNEVAGKSEFKNVERFPDAQRYTVKSIEADHLVSEDISVNLIHIPGYSIKAIVRVKLPGN